MTLTVDFVITAFAFVAIVLLFFSTTGLGGGEPILRHSELLTELPYGWIGVLGRAAVRHVVLPRHRGHMPGCRGGAFARPLDPARHDGRHDHAADRRDHDLVRLRRADAMGVSGAGGDTAV
jgi:hypothetical protein